MTSSPSKAPSPDTVLLGGSVVRNNILVLYTRMHVLDGRPTTLGSRTNFSKSTHSDVDSLGDWPPGTRIGIRLPKCSGFQTSF